MAHRTHASSHARHIATIVGAGAHDGARQGVTPLIVHSWERCLKKYRLDPCGQPSLVVLEGTALKDYRERWHGILEIAQGEARRLYEQTADSGAAIVFTDPGGVILDYVCDPGLEGMLNRSGMLRGALWGEEHQGTNGMGTCLCEDRPVTVYHDDHFFDAFAGLICTSVPVHDPHGGLLGALDITSWNSGDSRRSQVHTMALTRMTVGFIEHRYFQHHFRDATILRFHSRPEFLGIVNEGMMALDEEGRVLAVNDSALTQLCYAGREQLIGRPVGEIFTIDQVDLADGTGTGAHHIWPVFDVRHGRRYLALLLKPERPPSRPVGTVRRQAAVTVAPAKEHACLDMKRLIGGDPRMAYNARCASRVADKDVYILLTGETGTGKEVFARAVHEASARAGRPFVALNCAAIPESLIESELFGYKHGAFTGARREGMRGCVLESSGGTLFLDEIGDMPYALQTRLLRVLESREVVPLGGQAPVSVDLHVISATHRDLKTLVENGSFREDLYFRLNGISLHLPALRERRDLEQILRCVLAAENDTGEVISVDHVAFNQLLRYPWPGNIRELRNVVRTALALSDDGIIRLADLPKEIAVYRDTAGPCSGPPVVAAEPAGQGECSPLEAAEREALLRELERNRWNVTVSAERLGMSRSTLYRKLKKYDIPVTQAHEPSPGD